MVYKFLEFYLHAPKYRLKYLHYIQCKYFDLRFQKIIQILILHQ